MLELSEAIRDYHDHTGLPQMVSSWIAVYSSWCFLLAIYSFLVIMWVHAHVKIHKGWLYLLHMHVRHTFTLTDIVKSYT